MRSFDLSPGVRFTEPTAVGLVAESPPSIAIISGSSRRRASGRESARRTGADRCPSNLARAAGVFGGRRLQISTMCGMFAPGFVFGLISTARTVTGMHLKPGVLLRGSALRGTKTFASG